MISDSLHQPRRIVRTRSTDRIQSLDDGTIWTRSPLSRAPITTLGLGQTLKQTILTGVSPTELYAVTQVERCRPKALRHYDQIPMQSPDLLCQVKLFASYFAGKSIVFVGDHDGAALLLGMLSTLNAVAAPARIVIIDFDERVLDTARSFGLRHNFAELLETVAYNVFDAPPKELVNRFDWFYTNPPYGSSNEGESARLFLTRCFELTRTDIGRGCLILPDDATRSWTRQAMYKTQQMIGRCGWRIDEKVDDLHHYHLDDDQDLGSSSTILSCNRTPDNQLNSGIRYSGRRVAFDEIQHFYGRTVKAPYPRYIRLDGQPDFNWDN